MYEEKDFKEHLDKANDILLETTGRTDGQISTLIKIWSEQNKQLEQKFEELKNRKLSNPWFIVIIIFASFVMGLLLGG